MLAIVDKVEIRLVSSAMAAWKRPGQENDKAPRAMSANASQKAPEKEEEEEEAAADLTTDRDETVPSPDDVLFVELHDFYKALETDGLTVTNMKAVYHHARATLVARVLLRTQSALQGTIPGEYPFQQDRTLSSMAFTSEMVLKARGTVPEYVKLTFDHLVRRCQSYLAQAGHDGSSYADMRLRDMSTSLKNELDAYKQSGYVRVPHSIAVCPRQIKALFWKVYALSWAIQIVDPVIYHVLLCNRFRLRELHALLPTPQKQAMLLAPFFEEALAYMNDALRSDAQAIEDEGLVGPYGKEDYDDDESSSSSDFSDQEEQQEFNQRQGPEWTGYQAARVFMGRLYRAVRDAYCETREDETESQVRAAYQCIR